MSTPTPLCTGGFNPLIFHSLFASGKTLPVIYDQVYTLEKLSEGLGAIERRETWGKAVVRVKEEETGEKSKL